MIYCLLAVHVLEIWLFGAGIYLIVQLPDLGQIVGPESLRLLDAIYLSATTYTTLGYGDLVLHGPVRFLMVTWSASFAYLEMGRYWRN